jgi:uncharacterized protein YjbJ (UPF0337 family)
MGGQETRGHEKKLLGEGKEIVGIVTGDSALEREGSREATEGAAQESVGKARRKVGNFVRGVAKAVKNKK